MEQQISAAFDSVNLINELNALSVKTEEQMDMISRNVEHLKIMMAKPDFVAELTNEQTLIINTLLE